MLKTQFAAFKRSSDNWVFLVNPGGLRHETMNKAPRRSTNSYEVRSYT